MSQQGVLYILPGLLGEQSGAELLCGFEIGLLKELRVYFAENERTARRFLRKAGFEGDLNEVQIHRLDKNTDQKSIRTYLSLVKEGQNAGLLSEAGMPALADPGANLIRSAHKWDIKVIPVPGPSAILLAIVSSGLNGQQFTFNGYLPINEPEKLSRIRQLEEVASQTGYAQFFIETPYRNNRLLNDLLKVCREETLLSIAANLTEPGAWNKTLPVSTWKKNLPDLQKIPVVFGIC